MKVHVGFASSDVEDDTTEEQQLYNVEIIEQKGNLFDAPDGTILAHACNCMGTWGAGIALEFLRRYPRAAKVYKDTCLRNKNKLGTCVLIPPMEDSGPKHYIACLFTSFKYGRYKDSKDKILLNTRTSFRDLLEQINSTGINSHQIRMPKINSKNFKVPWNETVKYIKDIQTTERKQVLVVDLN